MVLPQSPPVKAQFEAGQRGKLLSPDRRDRHIASPEQCVTVQDNHPGCLRDGPPKSPQFCGNSTSTQPQCVEDYIDGKDRRHTGFRHRPQTGTTFNGIFSTAPFDQDFSSQDPADLASEHDMATRVQLSVDGCDSAFIRTRRQPTASAEIGTGSPSVSSIRFGRGRGLSSLYGDGEGGVKLPSY